MRSGGFEMADQQNTALDLRVMRATPSDRLPLQHMLELYQHDLSDYWDMELDEHGLYGYRLDAYWLNANYHPFVFRVGGRYAGFALVNDMVCRPDSHYWMAQYFVLRRYRGRGVAQRAALQIFDTLPGRWEVAQVPRNLPAQAFWSKVIAGYTVNDFEVARWQDGPWEGPMQCFDNRGRASYPLALD